MQDILGKLHPCLNAQKIEDDFRSQWCLDSTSVSERVGAIITMNIQQIEMSGATGDPSQDLLSIIQSYNSGKTSSSSATATMPPGMTYVHASAYAKSHRYGWHARNALPWCHQLWWYMDLRVPACGIPLKRDRSSSTMARPSAWSVGRSGGAGGLAAWVSARGFLPTGCRSLVRCIRLVLLRAGDIESNPGPDGGPCVSCGLTPAPGKRALLQCMEGCGRECHC
jgi:hypothetical protein